MATVDSMFPMIAAGLSSLACFLLVTSVLKLGGDRAVREAASARLRRMRGAGAGQGGRPEAGPGLLGQGVAGLLVRFGGMLGGTSEAGKRPGKGGIRYGCSWSGPASASPRLPGPSSGRGCC